MIEVRPLDDREMFRFYKVPVLPVATGFAGRDGLRTVIVGGLTPGIDGRVWGFIDFKPGYRRNIIYRYMLRLLDDARRNGISEIYVARNASWDTSQRLLERGGFRKTEEIIDGHEIWVWQNGEMERHG